MSGCDSSEGNAPSHASRRLVLRRQHDDRRPRRIREDVDQLVRVRRLAAGRGDDRLEPLDADGPRAQSEALRDELELVELARADAPEVVRVVAEPQIHAIALDLVHVAARLDGGHEQADRVRADVDDRHPHARDCRERVGRSSRHAARERRDARA